MIANGERSLPQLEFAAWIAFVIYLVLVIGFAWKPTPFSQSLAAIGIAIACVHAAFTMFFTSMLAMLRLITDDLQS